MEVLDKVKQDLKPVQQMKIAEEDDNDEDDSAQEIVD